MDAPLGTFDTAVGGLTVARGVASRPPSEKIVLRGDPAEGLDQVVAAAGART